MKLSSKMNQNLPYYWNTKTHVVFFHFISCYFIFFPDIDQGIHWGEKLSRTKNETRKKLSVFLYSKNMANFKVFR